MRLFWKPCQNKAIQMVAKLIPAVYIYATGGKLGVKLCGKVSKSEKNELSGSLARHSLHRWLLWVVIVYIIYNQPQLCAVNRGSATICVAQV